MIKVQTDSRLITKGDTFIALKGLSNDGHKYILEAIQKGATKIICEHGRYSVPTIIVKDSKEYLNKYLITKYDNLLNEIKFIGITGTNGKTTTAFLSYQLLNRLGYKTAYIGTIGFYINNKFIKMLNNTCPDIISLYNLILEAKSSNCEYIILEVSSHALVQDRLSGIKFKMAAFTNLTQDHLDYHHNINEYLKAKLMILDKLEGSIIVNTDDKYSEYFINEHAITLGKISSDYHLINVENNQNQTIITFIFENQEYNVKISLTPYFNVYNILTTIAIVHELGNDINEIIKLIAYLNNPKGRSEKIIINNSMVIIDYAHTPDAVEKIISGFNELKENRIITIIGCGGDRDSYKRPIMARIATSNSDYVIFTSDNPRNEKPCNIIEDMVKGIKKKNYEIEIDRKKAIKKGITMLKEKDILLILGKGHEDYQIIGNKKFHLDDAEEVRKYIKN